MSNLRLPRKWDALLVYLVLEGASALFIQIAVTTYAIYYATTIGMDALQLVLVGTLFETTIFLFEIPTGVVADVYSRRLSIIIGIGLLGIGLMIAGFIPVFAAILVSEILTGIGATFTSGATEAWITDEIGVERAGKAFIRAGQLRIICGILGIILSVMLASISLNWPMGAAGLLLVGLNVFLIVVMPERGFQHRAERQTWTALFKTLRDGVRLIRLRPVLMVVLAVEFIIAFHSEGFDHLWQKHILDAFTLPMLGSLNPVVWFGVIGVGANLLGLALSEIVRRRIKLDKPARALLIINALAAVSILVFAVARDFALAIGAFWLMSALRQAGDPISKTWLNQYADPHIRATLFSVRGQTGAIGEIIGGPPVGLIGSLISVRAALMTSGFVLMLALPLLAKETTQRSTITSQSSD